MALGVGSGLLFYGSHFGLKLTLPEEDLVARLLRSVSLNLTPEERRDTILLNAKSLLDLDADARFFAARILLSYIYEETLSWRVADGPGTGAPAGSLTPVVRSCQAHTDTGRDLATSCCPTRE